MKSKIQAISTIIENTGLIERWGGWCFNKTDKDLPIGVAITNTTKGTLYGYDDNFYSSGYIWVKDIVSTGIRNQVKVTVGIYIFTPRTKWDEEMNTYDLPLDLYAQLNRTYKEIRFNSVINDKYIANEVALIEIDFLTYGDCSLPTPVWWDFEGTLTVGEYEGEGEVMEYGYRAGWGEDYGSIADFYTYYEYAGIYWTEGVLYVWGVNASVVQIGSVVLNEGTYNSLGYTSFVLDDNPFTGATAAIKVKGDATETWDYEGVMTAGSTGGSIIGFGYTSSTVIMGSCDPKPLFIRIFTNNTGIVTLWNDATHLKIDNTVYTRASYSVLLNRPISTFGDGTAPNFVDEEQYQIKIKLV